MNKKGYKFFLFCIFILLASTFLLTGCVSQDEEEDVVVEDSLQEGEYLDERSQEEEVDEVVVSDFSKFSTQDQFLGERGGKYEITFFTEKPMEGFHRFTFELEGDSEIPEVSATSRLEAGALRLAFQGIREDLSGLDYQNSYDIDENGVVRIYHNVSFEESEEIYDIGVSQSAEFSLHADKLEEGKWRVNLDVRYPGEVDVDIDEGRVDFSTQEQTLEGATSDDEARVTNYSYGVQNNIFRFIWSVRGSQEKPIPQVNARYNDDGELVVTFPDLYSDHIGRNSSEVDLVGGVEKVSWNRKGDETVYRFTLREEKGFRIIPSLGPNQVILEIER